jgi:hypothetical protein
MNGPETINALDLATLTPLVQRASGGYLTAVGQWSVQQLHGGFGEAGVYRVSGESIGNGSPRPWSLILKVLQRAEPGSAVSDWDYWRREADLYQSGLLTDLPAGVKTPHCFEVAEPVDGTVWLWLEDIEEESAAWTLAEYRRVAHQFGQFNGQFLNEGSVPDYPWLSRNWLRCLVEANTPAVNQLTQSLTERWVQRVWPRPVVNELLQLWAERDVYLSALERLPQTLCHLDVFPRNLLTRSRPGTLRETVAIDWAFSGFAALGEELASLIVASATLMEVELLAARELEEQALAAYIDGLHVGGWRGDPRLVRLGYASSAALRFGLGTLRQLMPVLLDERSHPVMEQLTGHPIYELCELSGILASRFTLRLAGEARQLMAELGHA